MDELAVEVAGLWKYFGMTPALRNVSLEVSPGDRVAILGHNGAGKSTLLRILSGLSRPTCGSVHISGYDPWGDGVSVRQRIGAVLHQPLLYSDLTAEENLYFYGRIYGLSDLGERVPYLLKQVGLGKKGQELVRHFSRGMQQRLALARALLHDPSLLLLDEPDTGLDVYALTALEQVITQSEKTIVLTTHNLERALTLADRIVFMVSGRIVSSTSSDGMGLGELKDIYENLSGRHN